MAVQQKKETSRIANPFTKRTPKLLDWLISRIVRERATPHFPPAQSAKNLLKFETFEPRLLLSGTPVPPSEVAVVSGQIDTPGETDRYAFTLDEPIKVVLASRVPSLRLACLPEPHLQ